jgi:hypothetical protein
MCGRALVMAQAIESRRDQGCLSAQGA